MASATPATAAARPLAGRGQTSLAPSSPQVAVILINFSNNTSTPWTPTTIANTLFNNPYSVAAYYAEQSHGKTMLTGTVFGWYTIAATDATCDYATWANLANATAGSAINAYSNVMYVFPFVPACGWAGLGSMPGSQTWISGYADLRVMGHELGHNFGVHHANSLQCTVGGTRVALAASGCSSEEYGDPFSIMGDASTRQFPAFHKGELGWLQPTSTYTVTSSGTYTIAASELDTGATQLLRIPRTGGALYVDVRQPYGTYFDNFLPGSEPVSGVMLRTARRPTTARSRTSSTPRPARRRWRRRARRRPVADRSGQRRHDHDHRHHGGRRDRDGDGAGRGQRAVGTGRRRRACGRRRGRHHLVGGHRRHRRHELPRVTATA